MIPSSWISPLIRTNQDRRAIPYSVEVVVTSLFPPRRLTISNKRSKLGVFASVVCQNGSARIQVSHTRFSYGPANNDLLVLSTWRVGVDLRLVCCFSMIPISRNTLCIDRLHTVRLRIHRFRNSILTDISRMIRLHSVTLTCRHSVRYPTAGLLHLTPGILNHITVYGHLKVRINIHTEILLSTRRIGLNPLPLMPLSHMP